MKKIILILSFALALVSGAYAQQQTVNEYVSETKTSKMKLLRVADEFKSFNRQSAIGSGVRIVGGIFVVAGVLGLSPAVAIIGGLTMITGSIVNGLARRHIKKAGEYLEDYVYQ